MSDEILMQIIRSHDAQFTEMRQYLSRMQWGMFLLMATTLVQIVLRFYP